MIGTIRVWIIVTIIGASCVGAAGIYGPQVARNIIPQFFVARAMLNLAQEVTPEANNMQAAVELIETILNDSWRQDLVVGVNHLEGDISTHIDPSILAAVPMTSLRSIVRWDNTREAFEAEMALQMAATTIASAALYLDRDMIAVNIPLLFDFGLTVNPRRLGSEWDASLLGGMLFSGIIDDQSFYQIYTEIIFDPMEQVETDISGFISSMPELLRHIDFEYGGRQNLDDDIIVGSIDVFYLTVPVFQLNTSAKHLMEDITFVEDLNITLFINGRQVVGIDYETRVEVNRLALSQSGQIRFTEARQIQFEVISLEAGMDFMHSVQGNLSFDEGMGYQSISFDINLAERRQLLSSTHVPRDFFAINMEGQMRLSPQYNRIEADLRDLSVYWQNSEISLNARYTIQVDNTPVIFDNSNTKPLTDLNLFDLLGVYTRLEDSPLGGMLGSLLP